VFRFAPPRIGFVFHEGALFDSSPSPKRRYRLHEKGQDEEKIEAASE